MTDPGPEFWRRQTDQLVVINAIRALIDAEPGRFTGLSCEGSAVVTIYVVDPTVVTDDRLVPLLDDARSMNIRVAFTESLRSLRELAAINDEILRTDAFRRNDVHAAKFWIDPATATVEVLVADADLAVMRREFARHGDAVVVTGNGPPDLTMRLPRSAASRDGWPVPSLAADDAVGRPTGEVAELYRGEGFRVEVHRLGGPLAFESDLRPNRIRLLVHDGKVVDATQA